MTTAEKIIYPILLLVIVLGIFLSMTNPGYFENVYVVEDGYVENITALIIFLGGVLMLYRFLKLGMKKNGWFKFTTLSVALAFIFIAGEEISWGQRIFNVESSEFFMENNAQSETNLHNLEVGNVKLNKLIFGQIITTLIIIYLFIVPILFRRLKGFDKLLDKLAVPVPKVHHSIAFILFLALVLLISSGKKWELYEMSSGFVFFFILWKPLNNIYQ